MKFLKSQSVHLVLAALLCVGLGAIAVDKVQQATEDGLNMLVGVATAQPAANILATSQLSSDLGSLIKKASSSAGVYASTDQSGFNVSRVICVYNVAASSGAPTTNSINLQNKDIASGLYYGVATSGTAITVNTPVYAANGAGLSVTNGATVGALPVAAKWRVVLNVASAGSAVTGTVGCSVQ